MSWFTKCIDHLTLVHAELDLFKVFGGYCVSLDGISCCLISNGPRQPQAPSRQDQALVRDLISF